MKNGTFLTILIALAVAAPAQNQADLTRPTAATNVRQLITKPLDESQRTVLKGNTHPLARWQYDVGSAPASLPMDRMLLVLKRSPEQQIALRELLDSQQDKFSPNYHKWLTPNAFGKQFGASDSDIQVVNNWLRTHGFQVAQVSHGRTMIEFSGTAAQVQQTFGTAIHQYTVNGQQHWANASDPQIPVALAAVVAGVHTLHNFRKKPQVRVSPQQIKARYVSGLTPQVTFSGPPPAHALGPADYRKIYNAAQAISNGINGQGVSIAVVARSNLPNFGQDVADFRWVFNVGGNLYPNIIVNGPDPGNLGGGEEVEATLDTSWAGALAPNANIDVVVSASTNSTDGVDLSEFYIIDNNLAPIMTESFGGCEAGVTSAEANGIAVLAEQAAAQGITYIVSSGDSGSAGCDLPFHTTATFAPSVNVLASSLYTVAVGGTMFNENGQDSRYWAGQNDPSDFGSALSYIPEKVWNESCTPATCGQNAGLWSSGGGSSIFFSKPSWQSGFGPNDGKRDLPDVSLTAAGHDPYLLCLEGSCIPDSQGFIGLWAVSGTSAAAPAFAGIMALVNQQMGGPQGQANYVLYRLAANENFSQCNGSNTSSLPPNHCVFYDTTVGNNCVPGQTGYPSACTTYKSAVGYDLATGLGSVNISNLVNSWDTATFNATTTTLGMTPNPTTITHGSAVTANIAVTGNSGPPTGDVSLLTPAQSVALCTSLNACTLTPGAGNTSSLSVVTHLLPGGTYNIQANYPGDGHFAPSSSAPASVTVNPESSTTALTVASGFDSSGNPIPFTSGQYGSFMYLQADVAGKSGYGTPKGSVEFLDNGGFLNVIGLNPTGSATTPNGVFAVGVGTRSLTSYYFGDPSFSPSTSSATSVTITQATTTTSLQLPGSDSNGTILVATVGSASKGNAPSGTVTFFSDGSPLAAGIAVFGGTNQNNGTAQATAIVRSPISGNPTLTATYSGDANYVSSTSAPLIASPDFILSTAIGTDALLNSRGTTSTTTIIVDSIDAFSGTLSLTCSGLPFESTCTLPSSLTISPTSPSASSVLSITTTAPHAAMLPDQVNPQPWWNALGGVVFAGVFLLAGTRKSQARKLSMFGVVVLGFSLALVGCGGGGGGSSSGGGSGSTPDPGTPTGTYTITVTATSGTTTKITHATSFQLIVR